MLHQQYQDLEFIVVDDGSTDETWNTLVDYQQNYPQVLHIFRNERNSGITTSVNRALSAAKGKYVAFIGHDDIWLPEKLQKQLRVMEATPGCIFSYHDMEHFDSNSNDTLRFHNSGRAGSKPVEGESGLVARAVIEQLNWFVGGPSVVLRRDVLPPWQWEPRVPHAADWLCWIEVLVRNKGIVRYVPEVLVRYRVHDRNASQNRESMEIDLGTTLALVEVRYPMFADSVRRARGYWYYGRGVSAVKNGQSVEGRHLLTAGARCSWYSWKWVGWWLLSLFPRRS